MWNTVGPHSPAVYWRRRLIVLAFAVAVVLLIVLTVRALFSQDGGPSQAAAPPATPSPTATASSTGSSGQSAAGSPASSAAATTSKSSAKSSRSSASRSAAPPAPCTPGQLQVQAVVGQDRYNVGDHPKLILQVTNTGPKACVQDVADSQIELRVYNGASRVWGSHDCLVQPGVDKRTLEVNRPVGFSVEWSGLTAQPGCEGTRQRVGAGTYTLYASLSGQQGKAAQFSIS